jgi:hypothetical protein
MEIATMGTAGAEVLPIVLEGTDNTGGAWSSFVRNAKGGQSVIDQLKASMTGLQSGSVSSLGQIGNAAKMLANPYAAVTAMVVGLGGASLAAASDMAAIGTAADEVGTKGSNIVGLSDKLKRVGGDGDDAVTALRNLRGQLDLQARDGGYLDKIFKLNGSSITDAAGAIKPLDQAYSELAGFILNAKNGTEAMEIATNAFGATAAPAMKKAIDAGATSLARLGNADLDPLIRQSQEVAKIWNGMDKSGGSWWGQFMAGLATAGNNIKLNAARIAGSPEAADYLNRQNAALVPATADQRAASGPEPYQPSGTYTGDGVKKTTITPRNNADDPSAAAFEKASIAVAKHTAETLADTAAVDLGAGALEEMKTEAKLLATAQESGLPITQKMRDKIQDLAQDAGDATAALAKAKMISETAFARGTVFLTPEDAAIANQLKGIYGTDIPAALASTEAAALRVNNIFKDIATTGQDVNRGLFVDFTSNLRNGVSAWEAFKTAGTNALGKISDKLASMAADALWKAAFPTGSGSAFLNLIGLGGSDANPGSAANPLPGLTSADYEFDSGGYTGPGGKYQPAGTVHKGEVVFNQEDIADKGGVAAVEAFRTSRGYSGGGIVGGLPSIADITSPRGGAPVIMQDNRTIHIGEGASLQTVAELRAELAEDRKNKYSDTVKIFADAKTRGVIR